MTNKIGFIDFDTRQWLEHLDVCWVATNVLEEKNVLCFGKNKQNKSAVE